MELGNKYSRMYYILAIIAAMSTISPFGAANGQDPSQNSNQNIKPLAPASPFAAPGEASLSALHQQVPALESGHQHTDPKQDLIKELDKLSPAAAKRLRKVLLGKGFWSIFSTTKRKLAKNLPDELKQILKDYKPNKSATSENSSDIAKALHQTLYFIDKGSYAQKHADRSAQLAEKIARQMQSEGIKEIDEAFIKRIKEASLLVGLGKLTVAPELRSKTSKITAAEYKQFKKATTYAARTINKAKGCSKVADIISKHQEDYSASNPLESRIIMAAVAYDASLNRETDNIKYGSKAKNPAEALERMQESAGKQLDTKVVEALRKVAPQA